MRLLGLGEIRHERLRRLHAVAQGSHGGPVSPEQVWSKYTLLDLSELSVLVTLGGGTEAFSAGRRVVLGNIRGACAALRGQGFSYPLLQVPLLRERRTIFAFVFGQTVDPATGQVLLDDMIKGFPRGVLLPQITDPATREAAERTVEELVRSLAASPTSSANPSG
jgi:hypothetical protein